MVELQTLLFFSLAAIAAWPASFDGIRILGVFYLCWLAYKAITTSSAAKIEKKEPSKFAAIFRQAMLTSLLNPKALLFFMVFLPQFVNTGAGQVSLQLAILGFTLSTLAIVFHTALAFMSGQIRNVFGQQIRSGRIVKWLHASLFIGLALRLLLLEKPVTSKF
jgi:threonine/homoserine/homoserine lactone efflux protein